MRALFPSASIALMAFSLTPALLPAATAPGGFTVEMLVDGRPVPEYRSRDTRYVEALEGKDYEIRITNPLGVRVAVALAVDGLNTIDATRSTAAAAPKWVIEPHGTVVISGWQSSAREARRFVFTTEQRSYGQWLGQTANLGVISAVFFRERVRVATVGRSDGLDRDSRGAAGAPPPASAPAGAEATAGISGRDEYAATGAGRSLEHRVQRVWLELEPTPVAAIDIRYEFRPQLVKLGVVPPVGPADALRRREQARGFEPGFCPMPPR